MRTRNIGLDTFDFTVVGNIFRGAKRVCIIFAIAAVALCTLDLANVRSLETATQFVDNGRTRFAGLPDHIRFAIDTVSYMPAAASATVAIPRGEIAAKPKQAVLAAKTDSDMSPVAIQVANLAAARNLDAVEFAMESPFAAPKSQPRFSAEPAAPVPAPVIYASADPPPALTATFAPPSLSLPMSTAIPLDMVPMPRAAPGVPPPSPAERLKLEGKSYAKAERCLANAIYFEARSEPVRGQMAVAQVVINRAFSGFYPNDVCGVVYQNAHRHLSCQFTFACDGKSKAITERGHWARANRIAKQTLDGQIYVPEVAKSTHYHAVYVHPNWVHEMKKMVRYGVHNFYRPYAWGNGAEEPVWGTATMASVKKK